MNRCGKNDDIAGFDASCLLEEGHKNGCFFATPEVIESTIGNSKEDRQARYLNGCGYPHLWSSHTYDTREE